MSKRKSKSKNRTKNGMLRRRRLMALHNRQARQARLRSFSYSCSRS
jgi:hypothetical protein